MNEINQEESAELSHETIQAWTESIIAATKKDSTAPFNSENVPFLIYLMDHDFPAYVRLNKKLKALKVDMAMLKQVIALQRRNMNASDPEKKTQVDIIISMMSDVELFHDPSNIAYAGVSFDDGHRETWPVESKGFKHIVRGRFYKETESAPNAEAFKAAIETMVARAIVEGPEHPVHMRAAKIGEKIYIDLCNPEWSVVEIDADGYRILDNSPIYFRRKAGMQALPAPQDGGNISELRSFVNVKDDNSFILIVAWLLMALRGSGPYPILVVIGEHGTAKSTLVGWLRKLVDPNTSPLRTLPRDVQDLFIAATNGYVQAFDNLSFMPDWASDALCRLATGGGYSTRSLYTDDDEKLFDVIRPIIMNGIENVSTRGDLADRAIVVVLEPIPEEERKTTAELHEEFEAIYPHIFGALLKMVAHGIKNFPSVQLARAPRMADFAKWLAACETDVWSAGTFMAAYDANRSSIDEDTISASPLAMAVRAFMQKNKEWTGTATQLLEDLTDIADSRIVGDKRLWPSTPRVLSERLRRVTSTLRKIGIQVDTDVREAGGRVIQLTQTNKSGDSASGVTAATKPPLRKNGRKRPGTHESKGKRTPSKKPPKY